MAHVEITESDDDSLFIIGDGVKKIIVGTTQPLNPNIGDLWIDTN